MTLKQKNSIVVLFGNKLRKEPFLIDTDTSIGEKREKLKKNEEPDIILKTMNETNFGNTFNKILPDIEPYLKAVYNNKDSRKRLDIAIETSGAMMAFAVEEKMENSLEQTIEQQIKMRKKMENKNKLKRYT